MYVGVVVQVEFDFVFFVGIVDVCLFYDVVFFVYGDGFSGQVVVCCEVVKMVESVVLGVGVEVSFQVYVVFEIGQFGCQERQCYYIVGGQCEGVVECVFVQFVQVVVVLNFGCGGSSYFIMCCKVYSNGCWVVVVLYVYVFGVQFGVFYVVGLIGGVVDVGQCGELCFCVVGFQCVVWCLVY